MTQNATPTLAELHAAVTLLRHAALGTYRLHPDVREAINTLDNGDVFARLDEEIWDSLPR